jgi:hypothetical protein
MRILAKQQVFALLGPVLFAFAGPGLAQELEVSFDIHPTSCPNPFEPGDFLRSPTFPTALLGTDELDTSHVSLDNLVIVVPVGGGRGGIEIPPDHVSFDDVATPVEDNSNCACTTDGPDGYQDLVLHFDHDAIADALGPVQPGDEYVLCLRGELDDGTTFQGCDCIWIVGGGPPVAVESTSWGRTKVKYLR